MAALTYQATVQANNTVSVARSTVDGIGSAHVALILDNTLDKLTVREAIKGLLSALEEDGRRATSPAGYPTSGTVVVQ